MRYALQTTVLVLVATLSVAEAEPSTTNDAQTTSNTPPSVALVAVSTNDTSALTSELAKMSVLRQEEDLAVVRKTYEEFFGRYTTPPTDETNALVYADHACRFYQLLLSGGEKERATEMLRLTLKGRLQKVAWRNIVMELVELDLVLAEQSKGDEREQLLQEADKLMKGFSVF